MRSKILFSIMLFSLLMAACVPLAIAPATPTPVVTEEVPVPGVAVVQSIEVQILESQPLQVNAVLRGQLPDAGCTTIKSVEQERDGNTIKLTLVTTTDPLALCAQALTPFEQTVSLDVVGLPPAKYILSVSGVEQEFELLTRDTSKFQQVLVEAMNARDYALLKVLMDESFVIAYWLSEGTTNTPESATEQFRASFLNSSSPITANPDKDLVALLGVDPVTLAGPDSPELSPLYVSGMGAEGKDEAILFTARLTDGGLSWYGMLFAKDGFTPVSNPGINQPEDSGKTPAPTNKPPAPQVDRTPTIKIIQVVEDRTVTIQVNHYPADTKFEVRMGKMGTKGIDGILVDSINSRKGGTFTVTFDIPRKLYGQKQIAIRLESDSGYFSYNWFDNSDYAISTPPASVKYVKALDTIVIRTGPGPEYPAIGSVAKGKLSKVTGISVDGDWWRIVCPDDEADSCWISANPRNTKPSDGPKR